MQSEKRRKPRVWLIILITIPVLLIIAAAVTYFVGRNYYSTRFLPGTTVNGVSISGMTYEEALQQKMSYQLTVKERTKDGKSEEETITGDEVGLQFSNEEALKKILEEQDLDFWFVEVWFEEKEHTFDEVKMVSIDETLLDQTVAKLPGFQEDSDFVEKPKDAYLSDYKKGKGYKVVPEVVGNLLVEDKAEDLIRDAILTLQGQVDLDQKGVYKTVKVTSDDKKLNKLEKELNQYVNTNITYQFGDATETITGDMINSWLTVKDDQVILDETPIADFVANMKSSYDTIFSNRVFTTSYGKDVTVEGGDYGWWMNYDEEVAELTAQIKAGESGTRTPVYYQTAAAYGSNDIGNTYVEINLTAQHLYVYVDGQKVLETDFTSGNPSKGDETPTGTYGITYKAMDANLKGTDYESPVNYWMPFNGGVGMHDASWKTVFGSNYYKSVGSHGCINLPYYTAQKIYGYVDQNTPVICYQLSGTESKSTTQQSAAEIAQSLIDRINRIGTVSSYSAQQIRECYLLYYDMPSAAQAAVTNMNTLTAARKAYEAMGGTIETATKGTGTE